MRTRIRPGTTSTRGRPRLEGRREEVLRAAARVFSDLGYRHATLEDVAASLGVTRPALYHYAHSKDELLTACEVVAQDSLRGAVLEALRHETGRTQVSEFFRRYAEIVCDDFGRCFVLTDRRELTGDVAETYLRDQRELQDAVRGMLLTGARDGSLRKVDAADGARVLFSVFNGVARWYRPSGPRSPEQIAADLLAVLLEGLAP